jgi:regulatory protein
VDGAFSFALDSNTLTRAGLHIGEEISETEIKKLVQKDEFFRARDYGLLLLSYRDRSVRELRKRLLDRDFHREVVEELIDYFSKQGLVDDRIFTERWIEHTLESRPMGMMRIRHELRSKFVDDSVIEEVMRSRLDSDVERDLARRAASKKIRALEGYPSETARRRLQRFMRSRGFQFDIIHEVLKEHFGDDIQ